MFVVGVPDLGSVYNGIVGTEKTEEQRNQDHSAYGGTEGHPKSIGLELEELCVSVQIRTWKL